MTGTASARAEATGRLGVTPLGDVLISLLDRRLSGTLVVESPSGAKSALAVTNGCVVKARTAEPVARLGELLLSSGDLDVSALDIGLRLAARDRQLLGSCLVRTGNLSQSQLGEALSEQLFRRVGYMCGLPPGSLYGFYAEDFLSAWGSAHVESEPLALLWRCTRDYSNSERIDALLRRLAAVPMRLRAEVQLNRFGFGAEEEDCLAVLKRGASVLSDYLGSLPPGHQGRAKRIVYLLALTRHLDLADQRMPVGIDSVAPTAQQPRAYSGISLRAPTEAPVREPAAGPGSAPPAVSVELSTPQLGTHALRPSTPFPAPAAHEPPQAFGSSRPPHAVNDPREVASSGHWPQSSTNEIYRSSSPVPSSHIPVAGVAPDAAKGVGGDSDIPAPRPSSSIPAAAGGPSGHTDLAGVLARELEQKLGSQAQVTYYQLLGLSASATLEEIQAAYLREAKRWHPDRLPAHWAHLREQSARLFARLSEVHRVLSDSELRAAYDHVLASGESQEDTVSRVLSAAEDFRRAELLAKRNDHVSALRHAESAFRKDPAPVEHGALYAFLVIRSEERLDSRRIAELYELTDRAVKRDPENARFRFFRASVAQRAGRVDEAQRDFRLVLKVDRNHIDAAREVRLFNLRKEKESDRSGLLRGLFRRTPAPPPKSNVPPKGGAKR